jgi:hypothetical protein
LTTHISKIISTSPVLKILQGRISEEQKLEKNLMEHIPNNIRRLIAHTSTSGATATIYTNNGTAAARLRQMIPRYQQLLQTRTTRKITIKVKPLPPSTSVRGGQTKKLSTAARNAIGDMKKILRY